MRNLAHFYEGVKNLLVIDISWRGPFHVTVLQYIQQSGLLLYRNVYLYNCYISVIIHYPFLVMFNWNCKSEYLFQKSVLLGRNIHIFSGNVLWSLHCYTELESFRI